MEGYICIKSDETGICDLDRVVNTNIDKAEERIIELFEKTGFEYNIIKVTIN